MLQKIIEKQLKFLTKAVLKKQKPKIVTITGSIGKTSTKEAVYNAIKNKFSVRRSQKNYNNEIGVPMTVVGEMSPGKSLFGWIKIFIKFFKLAFFYNKDYSQVLVLEIGADKPGDLKYLMEMLPKDQLKACVLTAVSEAHLEFFGDLKGVFKEKITQFFYLTASGYAISNKDSVDSERIRQLISSRAVGFITYSIDKDADVIATEIKPESRGLSFVIKHNNNSAEFLLKNAISSHQAYALLAGVCVAVALDVSFSEAISGLKNYNILPGRMHLIRGINSSLIIDDTYNSSPEPAKKALKAVSALNYGRRKIVVLGDMLEMGSQSQDLHYEIGKLITDLNIDYVFTLGKQAKFIFDAVIKAGFIATNAEHFHEQMDLVSFLASFIEKNDVLLIKASQGMRFEKIVKSIMENPEKADVQLVRQSKEWLIK